MRTLIGLKKSMELLKLTPIVIMFTWIHVLLFILSDSIYFSSYAKIDGATGLTAAGAAMTKDGVGIAGCWENVTLCMTVRLNILSEDRKQSQGYGLWLIGNIQIVRLHESSVGCING